MPRTPGLHGFAAADRRHSHRRPAPDGRPRRAGPGVRLVASILLGVASGPGGARAESSLMLPYPTQIGSIPAHTYDDTGDRVGEAWMRISERPDGGVRLEGMSGIEGADSVQVRVDLEQVETTRPGRWLRPVHQQTQSFDAAGRSLGILAVDHRSGVATCTDPPGDSDEAESHTLALPAEDRVANVPLNLLFQSLARGERERVRFQILLCRGGPRIVPAQGTVVAHPDDAAKGRLVQIRYELSLPKLLSMVASRFLPRLSFWLEPMADARWVGHQMPLYSKGPTVTVVRDGLTPSDLPSGR